MLQIGEQIADAFCGHTKRSGGRSGVGEAVDGLYRVQFGLVGAEGFVPDHAGGAEVFVEVDPVRGMVDSVVRRGHEEPIKNAHATNGFGVLQLTNGQDQPTNHGMDGGVEAKQWCPKGDDGLVEHFGPGHADGSGHSELLGGVMHGVASPETPAAVLTPMRPVGDEIRDNPATNPGRRVGDRQVEDPGVLVNPQVDGEKQRFGPNHFDAEEAKTHNDGVERIVHINPAPTVDQNDHFNRSDEGNDPDEDGELCGFAHAFMVRDLVVAHYPANPPFLPGCSGGRFSRPGFGKSVCGEGGGVKQLTAVGFVRHGEVRERPNRPHC